MKPFDTIEAALTYAQLWGSGPFACLLRGYRVLLNITGPTWTLCDLGRAPE
jgi:hypothetical protein